MKKIIKNNISRRKLMKGVAAAGSVAAMPGFVRYSQAASSEPIKIGFQVHRTGIGAAYGRWYDRTTQAAVKVINDAGGINGRPVEVVAEDDGTDPKRGAEALEKFANQHSCDVAFGTLFSHVVIGSAPRAGELKLPYFVVSEGHHVASGMLNRYTLQPGITDVKSQVQAMAPFVKENLGKKVTMVYPDFAFGHDHRDYFSAAFEAQGGQIIAKVPIPPTESSFGFIDSVEAVDLSTPGLEFLDGSYFWEGNPRYAQANQSDHDKFYRAAIGVDANGASASDPKDVSTYAHMFGCWETLHIIKKGMEESGYSGVGDRAKLIEAVESMSDMPLSQAHPQGAKIFNGKTHQTFGHQYITKMTNGKLVLAHTTSIEDTFYPDEVDYTKQSF